MTRPLFLVLAYNQEAFIKDAVQAALAQTGTALDILISDDCSPDATFDFIQSSVAGYSGPHRVTVSRNQQNLGLVGHINALLERVENTHIILAAGDDISAPDRAAAIMEAFEVGSADLVHSDVEEIDVDGARLDAPAPRALFHRTTDLRRSSVGLGLYIGATGAIHRRLFDRYGALPQGTYEDLIFGFRAVLEGGAHHIPRPLVQYRAGIGISAEVRAQTVDDWRADRTKVLTRNIAVLEARLADAKTAGLAEDHPVSRHILKSRALTQTRLRMLGKSAGHAVRAVFRGDRHAASTWRSERKKERHALMRD